MSEKQPHKDSETPRTVDVAKVQSIFASFDLEEPTATTFFPQFKDDVILYGPAGDFPLNPDYALTVQSTMALMLILSDLEPIGYGAPPQAFAPASPYVYSSNVPFLKFSNGAVRNAGQLAIYWKSNFGDPGGKAAENNARLDIEWG